ncbi:long-chain fatty acid--CoA ligase [Pseudoalteromonas sp. MB47]|uniref:long-chain-fatty-acid--CoA ligase n=1 Tax=Pseudoalteromonas sp. MB47 TaxID=2588452 RepID=UPI00140C1982|nr:long-chain fatty acid--CoA ligase [Pseudoalteromonas sp. MB47]NHH90198.1 Long-chain-fatty-acid--CoA ligase [Pseudoalteromonas sp. MB47]
MNTHDNLTQLIEHSCKTYADFSAYTSVGRTFTFSQVEQQSRYLAQWFQQQSGLVAGDRIAIQLPNIVDYPIVTYAAFRAGLIVVNTNPLYTAREMLHQFNDADVKAIVILDALSEKLATIINDTSIKTVIVAAALAEPALQESQFSLNELIRQGERLAPLDAHQASRDDIAVLQYTGGTTGVAKAAMLSHGNILANAEQMNERFENILTPGQETGICPLPLYHIYAFTVNMVSLFAMGQFNVLIPNPRDLDALVKQIEPFDINYFSGINTLFIGLCMHPRFKALNFSNLKMTVSGGAALTHAAADAWMSTTGCTITEGYGLSETSPVVTLNDFQNEEIGSIGRPLSNTTVEIWDENDEPVADGESGEIVVKGPQVMMGYWQRQDETDKCMKRGFFKTGDVGLKLPSGNYKIVDRLKDMIIVSGFNVYPNEVENILCQHPAICEAAVIGAKDEKTGERVCAYITLKEQVDEQQVSDYCRENLSAYKVPKSIIFMEQLPKSTVGKILRRELRQQ